MAQQKLQANGFFHLGSPTTLGGSQSTSITVPAVLKEKKLLLG
jgi:hypothetical protein